MQLPRRTWIICASLPSPHPRPAAGDPPPPLVAASPLRVVPPAPPATPVAGDGAVHKVQVAGAESVDATAVVGGRIVDDRAMAEREIRGVDVEAAAAAEVLHPA